MKLRLEETRTFGIEIECLLPHRSQTLATRLTAAGIDCYVEGYNHRTRDYWKIVTDATISSMSGFRGVELVSPPLKGLDGLAQLSTACKVLNELGAKINTSCGLHVHHDARDLDFEAWKILAKSYVKYEDTIDAIMAPSRRGNSCQWARALAGSYAGQTMQDVWERIDAGYDMYSVRRVFGTRYVKLNLEAYEVHGTVEYRQHGGTTNFSKIAAWVCLTQGFLNRAAAHKRITLQATDKPFDSLMYTAGACPDVKRFYAARYTEAA